MTPGMSAGIAQVERRSEERAFRLKLPAIETAGLLRPA
jgi:hypothetical protein